MKALTVPLFQQRLLELQDNMLNFAYLLTSNNEEAHDIKSTRQSR